NAMTTTEVGRWIERTRTTFGGKVINRPHLVLFHRDGTESIRWVGDRTSSEIRSTAIAPRLVTGSRPRSEARSSSTRSARSGQPRFVLDEYAERRIQHWIDLTSDGRETGGVLLGKRVGDVITVFDASGPGANARRSSESFTADTDYFLAHEWRVL